MKFYVWFGFCILGTFVQAMTVEDKTKNYVDTINTCAQELGASKEDVMAVISKEKELSDSAKCLLNCVLKKFGLIGADGKLSIDGMKQMGSMMYPGDDSVIQVAEEIGNKCNTAADPGDSECEATFKYKSCMKEEMASHGITPP